MGIEVLDPPPAFLRFGESSHCFHWHLVVHGEEEFCDQEKRGGIGCVPKLTVDLSMLDE